MVKVSHGAWLGTSRIEGHEWRQLPLPSLVMFMISFLFQFSQHFEFRQANNLSSWNSKKSSYLLKGLHLVQCFSTFSLYCSPEEPFRHFVSSLPPIVPLLPHPPPGNQMLRNEILLDRVELWGTQNFVISKFFFTPTQTNFHLWVGEWYHLYWEYMAW